MHGRSGNPVSDRVKLAQTNEKTRTTAVLVTGVHGWMVAAEEFAHVLFSQVSAAKNAARDLGHL